MSTLGTCTLSLTDNKTAKQSSGHVLPARLGCFARLFSSEGQILCCWHWAARNLATVFGIGPHFAAEGRWLVIPSTMSPNLLF